MLPGGDGVTDLITEDNIYGGDERIGASLMRAYADATAWVGRNHQEPDADPHPNDGDDGPTPR